MLKLIRIQGTKQGPFSTLDIVKLIGCVSLLLVFDYVVGHTSPCGQAVTVQEP